MSMAFSVMLTHISTEHAKETIPVALGEFYQLNPPVGALSIDWEGRSHCKKTMNGSRFTFIHKTNVTNV